MRNELEPLERLLRDMRALARPDASRPPVSERLTAMLGGDLLAVVLAGLNSLEAGAFPRCSSPRRVA